MQELQRTNRRTFQHQTRTKALAVDTTAGDERSRIMGSLSKFASAAGVEADRQVKAEIETKKALGASRAATDLLKTDEMRQGITEDDVLATKLSYNAIVGQHDTMEASNNFVEWYKTNPEADEKTIADKKAELYQPLFEAFGGDDHSLKQISLQVQEAQFGLVPVQEKIYQEHRVQKNTEALTISVGDMLADPNVNLENLVNGDIPTQAKALGLDEFTYKKVLMTEMNTRASNGDARLLDQLSKTDWSKGSALIEKSRNQYEDWVAKENAVLIGDEMGSIELENSSLTVPWSTTLKKIENMNKRFPDTYSAVRIASLKQQRNAAQKAATKKKEMDESSFKAIYSEEGIPLALDGKWSETDKKNHVKQLDAYWNKKTQDLIASGQYDETSANTLMMKERLDWSRANRMVIPNLKANLDGLLSLNPEDYPNSQDLPSYAQQGMLLLKTMDNATLDLYLTDKDKAMALNIKSGMETRGDYSAFKRAYNVRQNPYRVSNDKRTEVNETVISEVKDKFTHNWASNMLGNKDVPEWQLEQVSGKINELATTNLYNGASDVDTNVKQSIAEGTKDYSQTFNGTLINKPKPVIAAKLGLDDKNVNKVDDYLEAYVLANQQKINDYVGEEVEVEDISFDVNESGTSFVLRHKGGEQIGGRLLFSDVQEAGRTANIKELREIQQEGAEASKQRLKEEKEASVEAAHMALFYATFQQQDKDK